MQQLVLNIEEKHFPLLVQFLETLDYVKIVKPVGTPVADSTCLAARRDWACRLPMGAQVGTV